MLERLFKNLAAHFATRGVRIGFYLYAVLAIWFIYAYSYTGELVLAPGPLQTTLSSVICAYPYVFLILTPLLSLITPVIETVIPTWRTDYKFIPLRAITHVFVVLITLPIVPLFFFYHLKGFGYMGGKCYDVLVRKASLVVRKKLSPVECEAFFSEKLETWAKGYENFKDTKLFTNAIGQLRNKYQTFVELYHTKPTRNMADFATEVQRIFLEIDQDFNAQMLAVAATPPVTTKTDTTTWGTTIWSGLTWCGTAIKGVCVKAVDFDDPIVVACWAGATFVAASAALNYFFDITSVIQRHMDNAGERTIATNNLLKIDAETQTRVFEAVNRRALIDETLQLFSVGNAFARIEALETTVDIMDGHSRLVTGLIQQLSSAGTVLRETAPEQITTALQPIHTRLADQIEQLNLVKKEYVTRAEYERFRENILDMVMMDRASITTISARLETIGEPLARMAMHPDTQRLARAPQFSNARR